MSPAPLQILRIAVLALVVLTGAPRIQAQAPLPTAPSDIEVPELAPHEAPESEVRTLTDGGKLVLVVDRELPLVDGLLMLPGGSELDPLGQAGRAELLAAGLRTGGAVAIDDERPGFTGLELDQWLASRAITLSIQVEDTGLTMRFGCMAEDLDPLLARLGQLFAAPAFEEGALEVARGQLIAATERRADDTAALADATIEMLLHGSGSPWGRIPTSATLKGLERPDLQAAAARTLGRDRLLIGLAGAIAPDAAAAAVEKAFAPLPTLGAAPQPPPMTFTQPERTTIYLLDRPGVTQTELRIAGQGLRLENPNQATLALWSHVVGTGGMDTRLTARIRSELGLAYGVGARFEPGLGVAGRFEAWCATRNDAAGDALSELLEVLLQSGAQPIPSSELDAARARMLQGEAFEVDTPRKVLERTMSLEFAGLSKDSWSQHRERIERVEPVMIQTQLRAVMPAGRFLCLAVGPADEIQRSLEMVADVVRIGAVTDLADASKELERMLTALGGRERWAALETVRIRQDVVFKTANGEAVVEVEQTRRFAPRAIRLKQKTPGGATYTNVVTAEEGWLRSPTGISPLPGTQVASWQNVLSRWFYYNVHRIAAGDPELRTGLDDTGRIVLMDTLGELGRITLGEDGLPVRFELREGGDDKLYEYSDWQAVDGYRFAMTYLDGIQHVKILEIEPNVAVDDATFSVH